MKTTLNAIEMTLPEGIQPIAMVGSGFLRAIVGKSEDRCRFSICREDPETGEIETSFGPGRYRACGEADGGRCLRLLT